MPAERLEPQSNGKQSKEHLEGSAVNESRLTEAQKLTAQISYSGLLLNRFIKDAHNELPALRERSMSSDRDILIDRVTGLADAYELYASMHKATANSDKLHDFNNRWKNSTELLTRVESMYPELQTDKKEIFENMQHVGAWPQRWKRHRAKQSVSSTLGRDQLELLYKNTDTTLEKEQEKTRAWLKTIGITLAWEAIPQFAGIFSAVSALPEHVGVDTRAERWVATVGLTIAMWYLIYGPNTKGNTNMVMDTGVSLSPTSKGAQETAQEYQNKDEETIRKRTNRWHWVYQTGWEAFYLGQAGLIAGVAGVDAGLDFAAGGAAAGIAKNLILLGYFKGREFHKLAKDVGLGTACNHVVETCKCFITGKPLPERPYAGRISPLNQQIFAERSGTLTEESDIPIANRQDL